LAHVGGQSDIGTAPLFSIVTVTLNAGQDLDATVESVRAQRCPAYEHIIKDGGSTDGSIDRLAPTEHLRLVRGRDEGIYDAMNQAVHHCTGKFVLFLNAGDVFSGADTIERVAGYVTRDPSPRLIYTDILELETHTVSENPNHLSPFFLFWMTMCHQACFFERSLFDELGGFKTNLRIAADHEFLIRAVLGARIPYIHAPFPAVAYKGRGVSAAPTAREKLDADKTSIRSMWFSPLQRGLYTVARALTLPRLRRTRTGAALTRSLRPLYVRFANRRGREG
jgi:glycosyltransferase involved in cell wall biosynthesis